MEDCISQASSLTVFMGWASLSFLIVALLWMVRQGTSKRNSVSMALVVIAHPMFWGRVSNPCPTPLEHSLLLFLALGVIVLTWDKIRPKDDVSSSNLS